MSSETNKQSEPHPPWASHLATKPGKLKKLMGMVHGNEKATKRPTVGEAKQTRRPASRCRTRGKSRNATGSPIILVLSASNIFTKFYISQAIQDSAIVTIEGEYEIAPKLSNGTSFNYLLNTQLMTLSDLKARFQGHDIIQRQITRKRYKTEL